LFIEQCICFTGEEVDGDFEGIGNFIDHINGWGYIPAFISANNRGIRLFGFYTTDIMSFVDEIGKKGTQSLATKLVEVKALSEGQGKLFYEAVIKKEKEYPVALGKPCNLLKYYFTNEEAYRANTIILPKEPLRKIGF
jgi:ferric iron reductase protein FhuF